MLPGGHIYWCRRRGLGVTRRACPVGERTGDTGAGPELRKRHSDGRSDTSALAPSLGLVTARHDRITTDFLLPPQPIIMVMTFFLEAKSSGAGIGFRVNLPVKWRSAPRLHGWTGPRPPGSDSSTRRCHCHSPGPRTGPRKCRVAAEAPFAPLKSGVWPGAALAARARQPVIGRGRTDRGSGTPAFRLPQ